MLISKQVRCPPNTRARVITPTHSVLSFHDNVALSTGRYYDWSPSEVKWKRGLKSPNFASIIEIFHLIPLKVKCLLKNNEFGFSLKTFILKSPEFESKKLFFLEHVVALASKQWHCLDQILTLNMYFGLITVQNRPLFSIEFVKVATFEEQTQ